MLSKKSVYLSYAPEARDRAEIVKKFLSSKNIFVYVNKSSKVDKQARENIYKCNAVVILFSKQADSNQKILIEAAAASSLKPIFCLKIERDSEPDNIKAFLLEANIFEWYEANDESVLNKLVELLNTNMKKIENNEQATADAGVFISYASSTKDWADILQDFLENKGLKVWRDKTNIQYGDSYYIEIKNAIKNCNVLVVLFSRDADESQNVGAEISLANSRNKPIFPIRIENETPDNLEYFLTNRQYEDWFDQGDEQPLNNLVVKIINQSHSKTKEAKKWQANIKRKLLNNINLIITTLTFVFCGLLYYSLSSQPILQNSNIERPVKKVWNVWELILNGTYEDIQEAVNNGVNFDVVDEEGYTVLHRVVEKSSDPRVIHLLIKNGLDVNARAKQSHGDTVLMYAVKNNSNPAIIQALLEEGADITEKIQWIDGFDTSLSIAVKSNPNSDIVKALLNAEEYGERRKILRGEISFGHAGILMGRNSYRTTLLGAAAAWGNPQVVQYILDERNCLVNAKSIDGRTALMEAAAFSDSPEIIRMLLAANADINAQDKDGKTALIEATWNPNLDIMETLINAKADTNIKSRFGTALTMAIDGIIRNENQADFVEMLLNASADINLQDNEGYTALMHASQHLMTTLNYDLYKIFSILLDNGAKLDIQNKEGETVFDLLKNNVDDTMIEEQELLVNIYNQFSQTAVYQGFIKEAKELAERSLNIQKELIDEDESTLSQRDLSALDPLLVLSQCYSILGVVTEIEGNVSEAKSYFEKSLKIMQKISEGISFLDDSSYLISGTSWAEETILKVNAELAIIYYNLGSIAKIENRLNDAEEFFTKAYGYEKAIKNVKQNK